MSTPQSTKQKVRAERANLRRDYAIFLASFHRYPYDTSVIVDLLEIIDDRIRILEDNYCECAKCQPTT